VTAGVVVGVDGSGGAAAALDWAAQEARLRGTVLTAVLATGAGNHGRFHRGSADPGVEDAAARRALEDAVTGALGPSGTAQVERMVVHDEPVRGLTWASDGADLLVVGARGLSSIGELLLGSVSQGCLHHARCPVAVVKGPVAGRAGGGGHVVVGLDGSRASGAALAWAVDEARRRGARVTVVRAHLAPLVDEVAEEAVLVWDQSTDASYARSAFDATVDRVDAGGVAVERLLVADSPGPAIVAAAADADLVVVGSSGRGRVPKRLVGSVSLYVTHHAGCPVVVLPPAV
jgi:nucleotide-binding universal stress UspA family protein